MKNSVRSFALVALLLGASQWAGRDANAGPVRGRISGHEKLFPEVFAEAAKRDSHRFTWREPSPTVKADFFKLTANPSRDICIAAIASDKVPPPDKPVLIRITGGQAFPSMIVVLPGTRLSLQNRDPFPHRLFDKGNPTAFPAEDMGMAGAREWTAPASEGRTEINDELFPSLHFFVYVKPQVAAIAYPGHDGIYSFPSLPGGNYLLQAYFEGKPTGKPANILAKDKLPLDVKELLSVEESK